MLQREEFQEMVKHGLRFLDGATGSCLKEAGMPNGVCTEQWVLDNPHVLQDLQRRYAQAGSQIICTPTFQAQPAALKRVGLDGQTEAINAKLAALTREAAPGVLVAGDLTTLAAYVDSWDEENFDLLVENYRRQIRGLLDGGVDLLAAETLLYPQDAEAILTAAEMEEATCCVYTFTMQPDGSLFSGREAGPVLRELEEAGAAATGCNCVAAGRSLPGLVRRLRTCLDGPLVCKPNAGIPTIGPDGLPRYPIAPTEFAQILSSCAAQGADLLGGCCGAGPEHIQKILELFDS